MTFSENEIFLIFNLIFYTVSLQEIFNINAPRNRNLRTFRRCRLILSNEYSERDIWVSVNFVQIWNEIFKVFYFRFSKFSS